MSRRIVGLAVALMVILGVIGYANSEAQRRRKAARRKEFVDAFHALSLVPGTSDRWIIPLLRDRILKSEDLDLTVEGGRTVLMMASFVGDASAVKALLDQGYNPNQADQEGGTPLFYAGASGNPEVVQLLISHGAMVEPRKSAPRPLTYAAHYGRWQMVRILLEHGADPNRRDAGGATAVFVAAAGGYQANSNALKVAEVLLKHGAQVDTRDSDGNTALQTARKAKFLDMVRLLKRFGAK